MVALLSKLSRTEIKNKIAQLPIKEGQQYRERNGGTLYCVDSVSYGGGRLDGLFLIDYYEILESGKTAQPFVSRCLESGEFAERYELA